LHTKIKSFTANKGQPEDSNRSSAASRRVVHERLVGPGRAYVRDQIGLGQMRLLVQMATEKRPAAHRDTDHPGARERREDRQIVELVINRMLVGRPFIAPPEIPAERLALMRSAFQKAVEDPELRAEAQKLRLAIDPCGAKKRTR